MVAVVAPERAYIRIYAPSVLPGQIEHAGYIRIYSRDATP